MSGDALSSIWNIIIVVELSNRTNRIGLASSEEACFGGTCSFVVSVDLMLWLWNGRMNCCDGIQHCVVDVSG